MGDLLAPLDRFVGILERLLGPPADQAGLALQDLIAVAGGDRLHYARERRRRNLERTLEKFQESVAQAEIDIQPVELKLLQPIFNSAALEEDDQLQERWAALLANAADPQRDFEVPPAFPEILKQLTSYEARILDALYEYANVVADQHGGIGTRGNRLRTAIRVALGGEEELYERLEKVLPPGGHVTDAQQIIVVWPVALSNLERLGLLRSEWIFGSRHDSIWPRDEFTDVPPREQLKRALSRRPERYFLTAIGYQFVRACRRPSKKSGESSPATPNEPA